MIAPVTGTYYLGVSGSNNTVYDPAVAGSGVSGNTATYTLTIKREDAAVSSISGITAVAASGTAAQSALPSANTGQTITLTGIDFNSNDQVVFENVDSSGRLTAFNVTPTAIAPDGTSMTVVVPVNASTGMVRLARELTGRFLQIVPTLTSFDDFSGVYHGGFMRFTGTGIYEQGLAVSFGGQTLVDHSPFTGLDAFSNTTVDISAVPEGLPTGPIRITTLGGTSAAFGPTFTTMTALATTGTAANGGIASANPGQAITLNGTAVSINTDVMFLVSHSNGAAHQRVVNPTVVNGTTDITVTVPTDAITGVVQIVGDQLNAARLLQIVPVVTNADLTFVNVNQANIRLTGLGFIEDNGTRYTFNTITVLDAGKTTGPDVFSNNTLADMVLPYSDNLFGAVTVTTAGGTSAPFSVGFAQLVSTAKSGMPANGAAASANPGQTVTLTGSGFTAQTDIVAKFLDDSGNLVIQGFNPNSGSVTGGGTQALLTIPTNYNGAFAVHILGSSFAPLLQIVPVVTSIDVNGTNSARVTGQGMVEGNGTVYHLGSTDLTDTAQGTGPDVFSSGTIADFTLPVGGPGNFRLTT